MATTIAVDSETRDRLRTFGHAGMTYDEILRRLMDGVERDRFIEDLNRRADKESDWVELDDFDWGD